jgi:hypothetical protein
VKLLRKSNPAPEPAPTPIIDSGAGKGRPTPKRRDTAPKRQPISAPRTAKEANQLRKQQATSSKTSAAKAMSTREYREALRRGDESVLPRRDKGPVRKLARDYVDTHWMFSNYLLLVFPLLLVAGYIPAHLGTYLTVGLFAIFAIEWMWVGRKIYTLATSRHDTVTDKGWVLGLYAGQRAFMPRRWRSPQATVRRGDAI